MCVEQSEFPDLTIRYLESVETFEDLPRYSKNTNFYRTIKGPYGPELYVGPLHHDFCMVKKDHYAYDSATDEWEKLKGLEGTYSSLQFQNVSTVSTFKSKLLETLEAIIEITKCPREDESYHTFLVNNAINSLNDLYSIEDKNEL